MATTLLLSVYVSGKNGQFAYVIISLTVFIVGDNVAKYENLSSGQSLTEIQNMAILVKC